MDKVVSLMQKEVTNKLIEYNKLSDILFEESKYWWKVLREEQFDNQFIRRAVIRSTFAFIEGVIHSLKQIMILLERENSFLKVGERLLMQSILFENLNLRLKENMLFTIDCFSRWMKIQIPLSDKDETWKDFKSAIKIRNRLMHPKESNDLIISDEELIIVNKSFIWFSDGVRICWAALLPSNKNNSS